MFTLQNLIKAWAAMPTGTRSEKQGKKAESVLLRNASNRLLRRIRIEQCRRDYTKGAAFHQCVLLAEISESLKKLIECYKVRVSYTGAVAFDRKVRLLISPKKSITWSPMGMTAARKNHWSLRIPRMAITTARKKSQSLRNSNMAMDRKLMWRMTISSDRL